MIGIEQISGEVKRAAREAGFDLAGIATLVEGAFPELERFPGWIEQGHAGEMEYLKARDEQGRLKRASVRNVAPWARSLVVCAAKYDSPHPLSTEGADRRRGWISRYAWGREDYHETMLRRLRQVEARFQKQYAATVGEAPRTWCYVDTGPVVERVYAKYAGLGWIGKNACTINEQLGSFLFLGVILTSAELAPDLPSADRCGSCTRCIDACPTDALVAPGVLDARRCISYLTIEKRGSIEEGLRAGMGRHVFGCDICQDVCPWNSKARRQLARAENGETRNELVNPALEWLATLDEQGFREVFRRSPIKRTKFSGMRRNLAIAMGNSGEPGFVPRLEEWARDPDQNLAEHARWALAQIAKAGDDGWKRGDAKTQPATR